MWQTAMQRTFQSIISISIIVLVFSGFPLLKAASAQDCNLTHLKSYLSRKNTSGGRPLIYRARVLETNEEYYEVLIEKIIFDYHVNILNQEPGESLKNIAGRKIAFNYYDSSDRLSVGEKRYFMLEKGGVSGGGGLLAGSIPEKGTIKKICFGIADEMISRFTRVSNPK